MKSNYAERRENRITAYQELAQKNYKQAQLSYESAHRILDHIPPGQPILIGHHSEKQHRADLNRADSRMHASVDAQNKAEYYEEKARAAKANDAISSDDPNAIALLESKIKKLENQQETHKQINKFIRKNDHDGLRGMGLSESVIKELFEPDFCGRIGIPDYALKNNYANIRRLQERLESLKRHANDTDSEIEQNGIRIVDNATENRVQIFFPGKPSEEIRIHLKGHGFCWARSLGCWQRMRSRYALEYAKEVLSM